MPSVEDQIVKCRECGASNKIPKEKLDSPSAKCGRCGAVLSNLSTQTSGASSDYKLRCSHCKARNRVPAAKLNQNPKCGKCGTLLQTTDILSGRPVVVNDADFSEKVLSSPLPVLMYAWAPWCSSCQSTAPVIDQFAAGSVGKVRVAKLNVDGNPILSSRFNILSVPFLLIFDKGELQESMPGGMNQQALMLKMARYL